MNRGISTTGEDNICCIQDPMKHSEGDLGSGFYIITTTSHQSSRSSSIDHLLVDDNIRRANFCDNAHPTLRKKMVSLEKSLLLASKLTLDNATDYIDGLISDLIAEDCSVSDKSSGSMDWENESMNSVSSMNSMNSILVTKRRRRKASNAPTSSLEQAEKALI